MKTQNTLENKAKFFAQYLGQHILYFSSDFLRKIDNLTLDSIENDDYLELKSLSHISNEDCLYLSREIFNFTQIKVEENIIKEIKRLLEHNGQTNIRQSEWLKVFDYLRKKGYALPYIDLSVEDLIEYGWIKLKEN